jgi:hypothetical protein
LHARNAVNAAPEAIQALAVTDINDSATGRPSRRQVYEIGAGTNEIRQMLIGRDLLETQAAAKGPGLAPSLGFAGHTPDM